MNKTMLMGRLTQDPEIRYTTTNKAVCNFRLAVKRRFSKQGEEDTDFFSVTAWEKTGEFCNSYFHKGQQVLVIGRLHNRTWNDEQGGKRTLTEVVAEEAYFADSKKEGTSQASFEAGQDNTDSAYPVDEKDELPF